MAKKEKRGRPRRTDRPIQIRAYISRGLLNAIRQSAQDNGRTQALEIEFRLRKIYEAEKAQAEQAQIAERVAHAA